jgi:mono/diheme cytochrome c family protein
MKAAVVGIGAMLLLASAAVGAAAADANSGDDFPKKNSLEAAIYRGNIVFNHYCALCHGATAEGNGRAAKIYNPRPANLVTTDKNDDYKELIIRRGGAAIGRSQYMPPWGEELTDEQVADVIKFLHSIQAKKP